MGTSATRRAWLIELVVAVAALGCGSSGSTGSGLTRTDDDVGDAQCTPDPAPVDPACVLCEPDVAAPAISGRLVVAGGEQIPVAAGGDPVGVWVGRDVVVQLPADAGGFVDVDNSSFQGSGWISFGADGSFEFLIEGEASVLLSGASTPIVRGASGGAKGTYSVSGTALGFSPECQFSDDPEAVGEAGGIRLDSNPFTVNGSTMTLQAQMEVSGFTVDVILELDAA